MKEGGWVESLQSKHKINVLSRQTQNLSPIGLTGGEKLLDARRKLK